jgi:ATP-dependent DNA helicase RecQ
MALNNDFIRLFYVGMTRAKKKLIIVTDNEYFKSNATPSVKNIFNNKKYIEPNKKTFVMGLSDLYMSFQSQHDSQHIDLIAGSEVYAQERTKNKPYYLIQHDILIAQFSKKMQNIILTQEAQGYSLSGVTIENVIEWFDEKSDMYKQLPLCKLSMIKKTFNR